MAELYHELLKDLRSEGLEKFTSQELSFLIECHNKAMRKMMNGVLIASGVTWAATRAMGLATVIQINLSAGVAWFFGKWRYNRSVGSLLDKILQQQGSLLHEKLANIILRKYDDDKRRMQLLSKFFVLENIFSDSIPDQPLRRWRYRNFSADTFIFGRRKRIFHYRRMSTNYNPVSVKVGAGDHKVDEDPLDYVLGDSTCTGWENIHHFNAWYASSLGIMEFDDWVDHDFMHLL